MREPTDFVPIIPPGLVSPKAGTAGHPEQHQDPISHRAPRSGWRALETTFGPARIRSHWG